MSPRLDVARDSAFTALQAHQQQAPTVWANRLCLAALVLALGVLGGLALVDFLTPCPHALFCAAMVGMPRPWPPRRCDPEAITEPGAILTDEEIEALDRRVRAAPAPRLRLVEAALDRQIAAKRETRSLPELLLATGAMQASHLRTPWHVRAARAARRAWANAVARWRFRRWYAAMLRDTHQRCRQQLRDLQA